MDVVVMTPIRLFGDGLAACLEGDGIALRSVVPDFAGLRHALGSVRADVALIDVTQGVDLDAVRSVACAFPAVALIALGLLGQQQDVIRCGRAGFCGYVERHASVELLRGTLQDAVAGRLNCNPEISGELLRALFRGRVEGEAMRPAEPLTRREGEVLQLIGEGLSNKEIATVLSLSIATVKHHVHHILVKLDLGRRAQAMRRVREAPWIAVSPCLADLRPLARRQGK
jgi:two-component system nitrate/nitrite response regulator NarL